MKNLLEYLELIERDKDKEIAIKRTHTLRTGCNSEYQWEPYARRKQIQCPIVNTYYRYVNAYGAVQTRGPSQTYSEWFDVLSNCLSSMYINFVLVLHIYTQIILLTHNIEFSLVWSEYWVCIFQPAYHHKNEFRNYFRLHNGGSSSIVYHAHTLTDTYTSWNSVSLVYVAMSPGKVPLSVTVPLPLFVNMGHCTGVDKKDGVIGQ